MKTLRYLLLVILLLPVGTTLAEEHNPDPFESMNRKLFAFNDGLDRWMLKPVAKGYDWITPDPVQRGVGNMFANMYDFNATINSALQWRWEGVALSGGRFLVNSTAGLLGFFDVASRVGIRPNRADFGQTLAVWGAKPGPYLMVPLFGPRTIRSGTGTIVDTYTSIPTYIDHVPLRNTLWGLELIDGRARLLNADELVSGDRYIFVRDAYLQSTEFFVSGGVVEDSFSDFAEDDWDDEEF